jgi:hypothetical protein
MLIVAIAHPSLKKKKKKKINRYIWGMETFNKT